MTVSYTHLDVYKRQVYASYVIHNNCRKSPKDIKYSFLLLRLLLSELLDLGAQI